MPRGASTALLTPINDAFHEYFLCLKSIGSIASQSQPTQSGALRILDVLFIQFRSMYNFKDYFKR